jgi:hypothetical protein
VRWAEEIRRAPRVELCFVAALLIGEGWLERMRGEEDVATAGSIADGWDLSWHTSPAWVDDGCSAVDFRGNGRI